MYATLCNTISALVTSLGAVAVVAWSWYQLSQPVIS